MGESVNLKKISHAGPRPTAKAIGQRFVWKNFKKDVHKWCKECEPCQKSVGIGVLAFTLVDNDNSYVSIYIYARSKNTVLVFYVDSTRDARSSLL